MSKIVIKPMETDAETVWVLEDNKRAIRFYEKCGFEPDGARQVLKLGTEIGEIRMVTDGRK